MSMKLNDLCPVQCHPAKASYVVPPPGTPREKFIFANEEGRHFYAVQPKNHDLTPMAEPDFNPSVAIVGLSPAANQIDDFVAAYRSTKDYDKAARSCCFRGLAEDIILMLEATGAASQLGLKFTRRDTFDMHPEVLCDSLVKCGSMTDKGDSTDWRPADFDVSKKCVVHRFLPNVLNPKYTRLKTILILGDKGWSAIDSIKTETGHSVRTALVNAGKRVLWFPHPSGENGEYVKLAKMQPFNFPACDAYVDSMWREYAPKPPRPGRKKQDESTYRKKRRTAWKTIADLRQSFGVCTS